MTKTNPKYVADWREVIADLNRRHEAKEARIEALRKRKAPVTLRAHMNDEKAGEKLAALNAELLAEQAGMEDLDEAIRQAEVELDKARQAQEAEQEAERLRELAGMAEKRVQQAKVVDQAARALAVALGAYYDTGTAMTRLLGSTDQGRNLARRVRSDGRADAAVAEHLAPLLPGMMRNPNDPRSGQSLEDLEEQQLSSLLIKPEAAAKITGAAA